MSDLSFITGIDIYCDKCGMRVTSINTAQYEDVIRRFRAENQEMRAKLDTIEYCKLVTVHLNPYFNLWRRFKLCWELLRRKTFTVNSMDLRWTDHAD